MCHLDGSTIRDKYYGRHYRAREIVGQARGQWDGPGVTRVYACMVAGGGDSHEQVAHSHASECVLSTRGGTRDMRDSNVFNHMPGKIFRGGRFGSLGYRRRAIGECRCRASMGKQE